MARLITTLLAFILGAACAVAIGFFTLPKFMLKEIQSPLGFDETVEQIEINAREVGWKVPKKWKANFQVNFKKIVGVDIGPNKLLKMCEPSAAADILIHDRYKILSVMMPCTIAVYQKNDGKTYISMMNMKFLSTMYGGEVAKAIDKVAPQMEKMVDLTAK